MKPYWFTVLAACGRIGFGPAAAPASDATLYDADAGDDARLPCTGPFGAPQLVPDMSSSGQDWGGHLTEDRLELYFGSTRLGGADLFVARRATPTDAFAPPVRLDELSTGASDDNPFLSADGLTMWFDSNTEIMVTTRATTSDPWSAPTLAPGINSLEDDVGFYLTADETSIYVTSARPGGAGGHDLWTARRASPAEAFPALVPAGPLNTAGFECCAYVPPGGTELWYTASGGFSEIRVIQRDPSTGLTSGASVASTLINSVDSEVDVFGTTDGEVIGFSSDRPGGPGLFDLYLMERSCP